MSPYSQITTVHTEFSDDSAYPLEAVIKDAIGGLCIGRSHADALGAWGPSATNKRHRVYTGALLAATTTSKNKG